MSIQHLRSKSFFNKAKHPREIILGNQKTKALKVSTSINQSVSVKKLKSPIIDCLNLSLSPTAPRFTYSIYSNQISKIESRFLFKPELDSNGKISVIFSVLEDLILISPELTTILSKIKTIFQECFLNLKHSSNILEEKLENSLEDLKRLEKRFKNIALECLDYQEQVKKRRSCIFELKKEKKHLFEEMDKKNEEIKKLKEEIHCLRRKDINEQDNKGEHKRNFNQLHVYIPRKSFDKFGIGSSQVSPIDLCTDIALASGAQGERLSPMLIQIPD
ncbi:hypothetical protein SteCoe_29488 [Stentor coeruleus]|uniref:Translin-associated factor X-interacting protein 1 N-terminal domain-containing protein n=1 Tax=Stentor coeruleus TaxID=5963 RepID=A0A1R2B689_9CILI|nr:hypothetical protein SteCoe_29488 [Stentor coeruleus]